MIGILDYGMGNLRSVQKAFEHLGYAARILRGPSELAGVDRLVLPGVGAFGQAIENLDHQGFISPLRRAIDQGKPLLGICLGMQLLFEESEEHGHHEGLGIFRGKVRRLPSEVKVPHIGWNQLRISRTSPLLEGIPDDAFFYFVQSFFVDPEDAGCVVGTTDYGVRFPAVVMRERIFGAQFHPEKSQDAGLQMLANFGGL